MFSRRTASILSPFFLLVWIVLLPCSAAKGEIIINQRYPVNKGSNLSAPTIVATDQCSQRVKVTSFVPGATIRIFLTAAHAGPVSPHKLIGGPVALPVDGLAVNLTQQLKYDDQVEATQTVNGVNSALSAPMTAGPMLNSLPEPTVDGKNIFACGVIAPVYNLESGWQAGRLDHRIADQLETGSTVMPGRWNSNRVPMRYGEHVLATGRNGEGGEGAGESVSGVFPIVAVKRIPE